MVTVEIPLIGEQWLMPEHLRNRLYKALFADPYNITYEFYDNWYQALCEEDKQKIRRLALASNNPSLQRSLPSS